MARQDQYGPMSLPQNEDLLNLVDVSDTAQSAQGSTKVISLLDFFANLLKLNTANTLTGALTLGAGSSIVGADKVVSAIELRDVSETAFSAGNKTGAATFNYTDGGYQYCTVTGNITSMAISNPPASGTLGTLTIEFIKTSAFTIAWPAAFRFPGGTDFQLTVTATSTDVVTMVTRDGGASWLVFEGAKAFA